MYKHCDQWYVRSWTLRTTSQPCRLPCCSPMPGRVSPFYPPISHPNHVPFSSGFFPLYIPLPVYNISQDPIITSRNDSPEAMSSSYPQKSPKWSVFWTCKAQMLGCGDDWGHSRWGKGSRIEAPSRCGRTFRVSNTGGEVWLGKVRENTKSKLHHQVLENISQ